MFMVCTDVRCYIRTCTYHMYRREYICLYVHVHVEHTCMYEEIAIMWAVVMEVKRL